MGVCAYYISDVFIYPRMESNVSAVITMVLTVKTLPDVILIVLVILHRHVVLFGLTPFINYLRVRALRFVLGRKYYYIN